VKFRTEQADAHLIIVLKLTVEPTFNMFRTEILELTLTKLLTLMLLESVENEQTEIDSETRSLFLIERLLERPTYDSTEQLSPIRVRPARDKPEPILIHCLSDMDDPKFTKSNVLKALPALQ
jgi:hypothetical protein